MDSQQGVSGNRPVVIQVAGSGDASEKNDGTASNRPQFVTLSTTGGQQVIISGNEGIDPGHQIITSSHFASWLTIRINPP